LDAGSPSPGPDGHRYVALGFPGTGTQGNPFTSIQEIQNACLIEGVGIAIFPPLSTDDVPLHLLSLGQLVALVEFGNLMGDPADIEEIEQMLLQEDSDADSDESVDLHIGSIPEVFLAFEIQKKIALYLRDVWKISELQVGMVMAHVFTPTRQIVLGKKEADFKNEDEVERFLESVEWFLPPSRGVMLALDEWDIDHVCPQILGKEYFNH